MNQESLYLIKYKSGMPKIKISQVMYTGIIFLVGLDVFLLITSHFGRANQLSIVLFYLFLSLGIYKLFIPSKNSEVEITNNLIDIKYFLLSLVSLLFIFHSFIFSSFINVAHDLSYIFPDVLSSLSIFPQTWESFLGGADLGHSQIASLWIQPLMSIYALLGRLHLDFSLLTKVTLVGQLAIGIYGVFSLLSLFDIPSPGKFISSIFYLSNTYFLTLVDGGLMFLSFAYSLLPLAIYTFIKFYQDPSFRNLSKSSLSLLVASYLDIRILPLFAVFILCWVIFNKPTLSRIKNIALLTMVQILGHIFWILPLLISKINPSFAYASSSQLSLFSFFSPGHLIFFSQPHWYTNLFGDIQPVAWYLFFIPILIFLPLFFLKSSNNKVKIFILLTLLSLFLSQGIQSPLGQIYLWMYSHIPGFAIFRDPSKFTILVSIGYTVLIALAFKILSVKIKSSILTVSLFTLLLVASYPAYTKRMSGTFTKNPFQEEYLSLSKFLSLKPDEFRILWVPRKHPLGYASQEKIWTEAISLLEKRPFLTTIDGSYELLNYLRSPAAPQLLDIISVKYIAYLVSDERKKPLKPDEREYYYWFRDWFKSRSWLKEVFSSPTLALYENLHYSPRFYLVKNFTQIIGGDNIYDRFNLRDTIISHTYPPQRLANNVVLNNTSKLDFSLAFLTSKQLLSPASRIQPDGTHPSGWWSRQTGDYIFLKNYLFDKHQVAFSDSDLGLGYAIAEGEKTLEISALVREGDLYARVLVSSSGGSLKFTLPRSTATIPTLSPSNSFNWFKIANITPLDRIRVTSTGNINILNALAVIPVSQNLAENIPSSTTVSPSSLPEVQYRSLSQTKYKITVPTSNVWLVFSESYDPQWVLSKDRDNYPSQIAYDMLNSFYIREPGEYTLEYLPQRYVPFGVAISLVTFLGLLAGIYAKRRV